MKLQLILVSVVLYVMLATLWICRTGLVALY